MIGRVQRVIHLHPDAPAKPAPGQPCNGCGVCCASEPCPLGILASLRRNGSCAALEWSPVQQRYVCGMLADARQYLPAAARWSAPLVSRAAARLISAGSGCDCSLEPVTAD